LGWGKKFTTPARIAIYTGYAQPDFVPKFGLSDLLEALNEAKKLLQD
jgi:hypothetical protein